MIVTPFTEIEEKGKIFYNWSYLLEVSRWKKFHIK